MNIKNILKHILFRFPESWIHKFYMLYNYLTFPNDREKLIKYGMLNPDTTFYVIRPRPGKIEGLMALFMDVIKQIDYAEKKGYVPIVDFKNYDTQYKDSNQKCKNVWEYYFKQISPYSLEEVYQSQKVYISGLNAIENCASELKQKFDDTSLKRVRNIVQKYIQYSNEVQEFVNIQLRNIDVENTIGLYLRGTDYLKLKPAGHPVQPSTEQAIKIVDKLMKQEKKQNVFLVTEDKEIYEQVKKHYGKYLKIVSYDKFISNYNGRNFLSTDTESISQLADAPYERGLNYLCKLIILSKCSSLVSGKTCGSWATCAFSDGFKEQYIFDLGIY